MIEVGDKDRWRNPDTQGRTRFDALWLRHVIRQAVRTYLDGEGFIEIDSPLLVRGATPDLNIDAVPVGERYLVTSTEYQIKRLEAGGFDRIYTLTQNFRAGDDHGRFRNAEFTMLEWARVGESLRDIERDVEKLILAAHKAIKGQGYIIYGSEYVDLALPWDRLTVREAISRHAGADLADFDPDSLWKAAEEAGLSPREDWRGDAPFLFSLLMGHVQPKLGLRKPVFIGEWPDFDTASTSGRGTGLVERSELIIAGIELCDGFPTLTDLDDQVEAFDREMKRRQSDGKPIVTLDGRYLSTLADGLPAGAGMALGFDRLAMILTDRQDINDVLAFTPSEI